LKDNDFFGHLRALRKNAWFAAALSACERQIWK